MIPSMDISPELRQFLEALEQAFKTDALQKLTLSKSVASTAGDLSNVFVRPVQIGKGSMLQFLYRYTTRDETRNYSLEEARTQLSSLLPAQFLNADLLAASGSWSLQYSRKRKPHLYARPAVAGLTTQSQAHDAPKRRFIRTQGNLYLRAMGITTDSGEVTAAGQRKYRQIDKYIEIIDSLLRQHPLPLAPRIVDMGAGKGYLTFALYDYLANHLGLQPQVIGLEIRPALVDAANALASSCGFAGLRFEAKDIHQYRSEGMDMLIALHACDILTDVALAEGVRAGAGILVAAPCCHKQIRKQIKAAPVLQPMLKHGILEERQAEILTDGLRALLLESRGYQTKVFEFVSMEHTNKNVMIAATRSNSPRPDAKAQIAALKQLFGIEYHYLEKLLAEIWGIGEGTIGQPLLRQ